AHIVNELKASPPEPKAEYDVAIIGIGPGGASAAAAAREANIRYIGIEQTKILSTIDLYPKGKYIFFKPDTKDWSGGIPVAGLGLSKAKYAAVEADDDQSIFDALGQELGMVAHEQAALLRGEMIGKIPRELH